ncbi:lipoprotein NlpI [Posidoniimonas polymericola]|uniref:Lipoprotein NlpI n=1 Tax=Posidoniimonas polymericola TaxID=2528002 RepID=A0A5C5YVH8_9BACT|nr:tetratricopeptide repeat protein [Posidoniimonas polymericola]TWT78527.1 lipoprotein NlpI [Posidoniimonas polymericola]
MATRTAALAFSLNLLLALVATPVALAQDEQAPSSPGQADLDQAIELKINATDLSELNKVIELLDSATDKGLDEENADFAKEMLVGSLLQRASSLSGVLLKQASGDPRRNPQWLQLRMMAVNDLRRIVTLNPNQTDAWLLLGRLQSMPRPLGDPTAARDALTRVIDAPEVEPEKRAQAYALRGVTRSDQNDRIADLDKAVELEPKKVEYLVLRARQLQAADRTEDALADVEKAIEIDAENPSIFQLKALLLISEEKLDEAMESFDKAAELAPEDITSYQLRSQLFEKMGDPEKALAQIDKAIELKPDSAGARLLKVNLLIKAERLDDALAAVDELLELRPGLVQGLMIRAQLLEGLERHDEALAVLEKLAEALPEQPEVHLQLAAHYMDNQQPTRAIEELTKVLDVAPDNQVALRLRGDMYLSVGKHPEAIADFAKAYEQNPDDSGLLNNYAWTLATSPFDELRNGERAVELAKQACELTDYKAPHILSTLAAAYSETGDFETAIEWSTKAVQMSEEAGPNPMTEELSKELASYMAGKPWRELQQEEDLDPLTEDPGDMPSEEDAPAPARSLDF